MDVIKKTLEFFSEPLSRNAGRGAASMRGERLTQWAAARKGRGRGN